MSPRWKISVATLAVALVAGMAWADTFVRTPLRADHPLIGAWRISLPPAGCQEVYYVQADGVLRVTSGAQVAESEFQIPAQASKQGFYKWVDRITRDNGKPDCMGSVVAVGHIATNYILLHPSGAQFLMCEKEDIRSCIGPFVRDEGI